MKGDTCVVNGSLQPSRNEFVLLFCQDHFEVKPVSFSAIGMQEVKTGDRKRTAAATTLNDAPNPKRPKHAESDAIYQEDQLHAKHSHAESLPPSSAPAISFALSKPKPSSSSLAHAATLHNAESNAQSLTLPHLTRKEQPNTVMDDPDSDDSDASE